jgi:geranylgeranyl diphosphate synthase type II
MKSAVEIKNEFEDYIKNHEFNGSPQSLYDPINYILSLKAKRARPNLLLLSHQLFESDMTASFSKALAIEVFHNFTLLHDDIMDEADLRRGQPTVHKKYNENTAILSGDVMMIMSMQLLDLHESENSSVIREIFTQAAVDICEGQQMDMDFETSDTVTIQDYIEMIKKKTAVLLGVSMQIGALSADAELDQAKGLYQFGEQFGISFQIQDDLLDTFGDGHKVGKEIGGDIRQGKKTYLYLKALELLEGQAQMDFKNLYQSDADDKVDKVKEIFKSNGVDEYARQLRDAYHDLALGHLNQIKADAQALNKLKEYLELFIKRDS